ncbi:MAG: alkaline phosphatase D family protein [Planctomycetota bacterium]
MSLRQAHQGTLKTDMSLLDSYGPPPDALRRFYLASREVFEGNGNAGFSDPSIIEAAARYQLPLMGGPMLGDLTDRGVTIWFRPATTSPLRVKIDEHAYPVVAKHPGQAVRLMIDNLNANSAYTFHVERKGEVIADGQFRTAPAESSVDSFRIAFGSCCHKIGIHNVNLFNTVVSRQPHAMMLLGDLAVDDRNDQINMHRADYQLRDVSTAWRHLVSNVTVYAAWDDHDYFDNDLSGVPRGFKEDDREQVRAVWQENWNNPPTDEPQSGIYFNRRVGPVEIIMLDTRSCRDRSQRNRPHSFLGEDQLNWLKKTLVESTAPFKVISSGTMWSDYVSRAKDSWGTWDKSTREVIFDWIELQDVSGVLLVSGDRHGARGFRIPRPSGKSFYEFEPATLGGASGPAGLVEGCAEQLFGYDGHDDSGNDFVAFGEFTFDTQLKVPSVTFRLISQFGEVLEELALDVNELP